MRISHTLGDTVVSGQIYHTSLIVLCHNCKTMEVIAISGKKGTGKDWKASQLLNSDPTYTALIAFADPLKQYLYGKGYRDVLLADKPIDTRALLIEIGTSKRLRHGTNFYAEQLVALLMLYKSRGIKRIIITDLRFKCELSVLKDREAAGDFTLRLLRMIAPNRNMLRIKREANGDHTQAARLAADSSETDLDDLEDSGQFELIFNDVLISSSSAEVISSEEGESLEEITYV